MPTEFAFRVSTYLSLALACVCLGYAEWELLPEVSGFTAAVLVLLGVSFRYEGRIELSLSRANAVGLGIAVVGVAWLAVKLTRPATGLMANLEWPTNILPYAGPVLLVLIPAKLLRPKHVGDWWAMQGVGLAAVGLAAAMSDDEVFVVLLCGYLFCAVMALTLFYYRRSGGHIAPIPTGSTAPPLPRPLVVFEQANVDPDAPPLYRFAAGRSLRWIAWAAAMAAPFFVLTPRTGAPSWGLAGTRMEVGLSSEQNIDLNRTGDLQTSREVALDVTVTAADGTPVDDLDPDSYWPARTLRLYESGKFQSQLGLAVFLRDDRDNLGQPGTGPAADVWAAEGRPPITLHIRLRAEPRAGNPVAVLGPVQWVPKRESPVRTLGRDREVAWLLSQDGHLDAPGLRASEGVRQTTVAAREPGLGPPITPSPNPADQQRLQALTRGAPDGVRRLAEQRVRQWMRDGTLPGDVLEDDRPGQTRVAVAYRPAVAAAFQAMLATSGEYEYTTTLRRQNKLMDPIEDFLVNVKAGHCERFAAAFALLLRGVGVPCQVVVGYRGHEALGEGKYSVLQEHAHAWVEVLIERPALAGGQGRPGGFVYHWQMVDPTAGGSGSTEPDRGWFGNARQWGYEFIADYILGFNPEKQRQAIADAKAFAGRWWPALAGLIGLWMLWRHRRRWLPARAAAVPHPLVTSSTPPWFLDYLTVTARLGLLPPTGQTPKEFAERVAAALRASPAGAGVAEVPAFVTSKFYRVRYGGTALTAGEEAEVSAAVARLLAAVQDLSVLVPRG